MKDMMDKDDKNMTMPMPMMMKFFHTGYEEMILFPGWKTENEWEFALSCVFVFLFCIFHEFLIHVRSKLIAKQSGNNYNNNNNNDECNNNNTVLPPLVLMRARFHDSGHYLITLLFGISLAFSYFIMLVVMTFNIYLFLSIILGLSLGQFLFRSSNGSSAPSEMCCDVGQSAGEKRISMVARRESQLKEALLESRQNNSQL